MICKKCGNENEDDSLFCDSCGAKLDKGRIGPYLIVLIIFIVVGSVVAILAGKKTNNESSENESYVDTVENEKDEVETNTESVSAASQNKNNQVSPNLNNKEKENKVREKSEEKEDNTADKLYYDNLQKLSDQANELMMLAQLDFERPRGFQDPKNYPDVRFWYFLTSYMDALAKKKIAPFYVEPIERINGESMDPLNYSSGFYSRVEYDYFTQMIIFGIFGAPPEDDPDHDYEFLYYNGGYIYFIDDGSGIEEEPVPKFYFVKKEEDCYCIVMEAEDDYIYIEAMLDKSMDDDYFWKFNRVTNTIPQYAKEYVMNNQ